MSKITKIVSNGYTKSKIMTKEATKEVLGVAHMPKEMQKGFEYGLRLSKIQKGTPCDTFVTVGRSVLRKGVVPYLPGLLAGIGLAVPVIGANPAGLVIGRFLKKALRKL